MRLLLLISAAWLPLAAHAQSLPDDPAGDREPANRITVLGGLGLLPSYEGSDDITLAPVGAINGEVDGHAFFTSGTAFYADLIRSPIEVEGFALEFGPVVGIRLNGSVSLRDARVAALGRRPVALEMGAFAGFTRTGVFTSDFDTLNFRVSVLHDVGSVHQSAIITPSVTYMTPLSRRNLVALSGSLTFAGDGYARRYFSVTPAGSLASGLPAFAPRGGLKNYNVTVIGVQSLSGDIRRGLSLFAMGSFSRLQGDFAASPLVRDAGSSGQIIAAAGIGFSF